MDKDRSIIIDNNWHVDTLWWIITGHCNLKCGHCYIEAPNQKYKQLSFKECIDIIDQAHNAGIKSIFISGGEPFIRNDLLEIIDAIYDKGMKIRGIESNSTLLNDKIISSVFDKSIVWHVSYDCNETHEELRGITGAEKKTISNIEMLLNAGFKVAINTTLSFLNFHQLLQTYDLLKKLSIYSWQIFPMTNIGSWRSMTKKEFTWQDEAQCYLRVFQQWLDDDKPFILSLSDLFTHKRLSDGSFSKAKYVCNYFRSTVTLLPDGILVPCCRYIVHPGVMSKMRSVFQYSIKDQIHSSELKKIKNITINDVLQKNSNCKNCRLIDVCQFGCRINAYLDTGNIFNKETKKCLLIKDYYEKYFMQHDFAEK